MRRKRNSAATDVAGAPSGAGSPQADAALGGAGAAAGRGARRSGRLLVVLAVAAILALALSEPLRARVLDVMFGAEEEFDYVSTTTPASAAPAAAGPA